MNPPPGDNLEHLRSLIDLPDLRGTKYDNPERLARGGMGSVFVVRDVELDRKVALKVLTVPDGEGGMKQRLLNEARIIARLEHPSIVPIHDVGVLSDGRIFYTMKLVQGKTLTEWTGGRPSLVERLQVMRQVCQALAFAHAHAVVHRDLKPDNVMVGPFGEVLVMDWGVAKRVDVKSPGPKTADESTGISTAIASTAHGAVIGTPAYMSPEQAAGKVGEIDERSDVYMLGGTLYFLLTGEPPPTGSGSKERDDYAATFGPPDPRTHDRTIRRPLAAICRKAMAPDKASRYGSAEVLERDLELFLLNEPVSAYPENFLRTYGRWIARNRLAVYILLTYIIVRAAIFFLLRH